MPSETQHLTLSKGLGGHDTKGPRGNSHTEGGIWLVSWAPTRYCCGAGLLQALLLAEAWLSSNTVRESQPKRL